jgi:hypothetical protein
MSTLPSSTLTVIGLLFSLASLAGLVWAPFPISRARQAQSNCSSTQAIDSAIVRASGRGCLSSTGRPYLWALIGNDTTHLRVDRTAGATTKVFRLDWRLFEPDEHSVDAAYVAETRAELARLRVAGFKIIIELGIQDTPSWLHDYYADSYYVDQYGDRYDGGGVIDSGDANLVFSPVLRALAAAYMHTVFALFGTDFLAVRLGGGHWGELTFPTQNYHGHTNCYWAFDHNALEHSPTPHWRPGQSSPHHADAYNFVNWYLDALVDFQNWQIRTIRRDYAGSLMVLYPGWGVRPSQVGSAISEDLAGNTDAEKTGELQTGHDFARQIQAVADNNVIVTTTWLDADATHDGGANQISWSPIKYLSSLATANPLQLHRFGENTGQGTKDAMIFSALQMRRYRLIGMAWYSETQLGSGHFATLDDYRAVISATRAANGARQQP